MVAAGELCCLSDNSGFSVKSPHFVSTVFQKVDGQYLRYATVISHLRLYQSIIDVSFVGSLMIKYFIWAIWWIQCLEFGMKM